MQLSFRLDKRPGESHLALDGKKFPGVGTQGSAVALQELLASIVALQVFEVGADYPSARRWDGQQGCRVFGCQRTQHKISFDDLVDGIPCYL